MRAKANQKTNPPDKFAAFVKELQAGARLEKSLRKLEEQRKAALDKKQKEGIPKPKNKLKPRYN